MILVADSYEPQPGGGEKLIVRHLFFGENAADAARHYEAHMQSDGVLRGEHCRKDVYWAPDGRVTGG